MGHVETTTGVVETTPANKAKKSATRGHASGSGESGSLPTSLVDVGKGE